MLELQQRKLSIQRSGIGDYCLAYLITTDTEKIAVQQRYQSFACATNKLVKLGYGRLFYGETLVGEL